MIRTILLTNGNKMLISYIMETNRLLRKVSSLINDRLIIDPKVPQ